MEFKFPFLIRRKEDLPPGPDSPETLTRATEYVQLLQSEAKKQLGQQAEKSVLEIQLKDLPKPILIRSQSLRSISKELLYDWYLVWPIDNHATIFAIHDRNPKSRDLSGEQRKSFLLQFGLDKPVLLERIHNRVRDYGLKKDNLEQFIQRDNLLPDDFFRSMYGRGINLQDGERLVEVSIGTTYKSPAVESKASASFELVPRQTY